MKEKSQKTDKSPKKDVNEGYWMPEEDRILMEYIQKHGPGRWKWLPKRAGLRRCGRSCRMRWLNYLRPDIKRGPFTLEEVDTIIRLQSIHGNRWTVIASQLPGRTDNDIKNYWKTHLQKRLLNKNSDQANCDPPSPSGLDPTCDSPPSHSILPMVEFKEKHSPPSCSGEDPTDHEPTSHSPPAVIESNKNKDPPSSSGLEPTNNRPRSHLVPNPTNQEQVSESPPAAVESAENDLLALWNSEVGESFRKFYYGLKEHFQRLNKTNKGEVVATSSSSHPAHVSFVINGDGSCPKQ